MMRERDVGWFSAGLLSLLLTGTSATAATPTDAATTQDGAIARLDEISAQLRDRLGAPPAKSRPAAGEAAPERHAQGWQNWPNWSNFWQNF